jgi:hypothetical protein
VRALSSKKSSILSRIKTTDFQSSTKIEALREEVHKMLQADPSAKAIVFSQFTSMLDLVSFRLEQVQQWWKTDIHRKLLEEKGFSKATERIASSACWILWPSDWNRYSDGRKPTVEEMLDANQFKK